MVYSSSITIIIIVSSSSSSRRSTISISISISIHTTIIIIISSSSSIRQGLQVDRGGPALLLRAGALLPPEAQGLQLKQITIAIIILIQHTTYTRTVKQAINIMNDNKETPNY